MKDQTSYSDIWIGSEDLGRDEKFVEQATREMPDASVASMLRKVLPLLQPIQVVVTFSNI